MLIKVRATFLVPSPPSLLSPEQEQRLGGLGTLSCSLRSGIRLSSVVDGMQGGCVISYRATVAPNTDTDLRSSSPSPQLLRRTGQAVEQICWIARIVGVEGVSSTSPAHREVGQRGQPILEQTPAPARLTLSAIAPGARHVANVYFLRSERSRYRPRPRLRHRAAGRQLAADGNRFHDVPPMPTTVTVCPTKCGSASDSFEASITTGWTGA
ncbi:hypothetical protein DFH06DRAFT_1376371 [Mycena polygramma]|nr:hypothetical protein DFH06DRAFT_1376371 [Mycena polygramma]